MNTTCHDHLVNLELLKIARQTLGGFGGSVKQAFIPGGDMSGGGGGGAPPGGDPSQGDPSAAAPPPGGDPSGGGGQDPMVAQLQAQVQQMQQQMMQMQQGGGGGAAGAGGAGALKPKVDTNAVLLQILKIQARIADQLGVKIPASEMVVNQQDLGQLAAATQTGQPMPGMDPTAPGGTGGQGGQGAIPQVDPMQGMAPAGVPGGDPTKQGSYKSNGVAFDSDGLGEIGNKAAAIARIRRHASGSK